MKIKAAIIGSGNIGTDLLYKARRSEWIEPVWMVGIDPASDGLKRAAGAGVDDHGRGRRRPGAARRPSDGVRIAFDATIAYAHPRTRASSRSAASSMIDLTPAAIGPYCIPPVNLTEHLGRRGHRTSTWSRCGGQATIPMVAAVSRVQPVEYAEIVATVASKSVGPGTRQNIDEFTRTTAGAVERVGGAKRGKAIIIINPAEPPLMMRDTIHCLTEGEPDQAAHHPLDPRHGAARCSATCPATRLKNGPVFDGRRVSTFVEVEGLGDYLPKYAGNLDIMTAAALRTGELFAERMASGRWR